MAKGVQKTILKVTFNINYLCNCFQQFFELKRSQQNKNRLKMTIQVCEGAFRCKPKYEQVAVLLDQLRIN